MKNMFRLLSMAPRFRTKFISHPEYSTCLPLILRALSTEVPSRRQITEGTVVDVEDIPREKLIFSFSKSSGPGGQNVNKLNTKVEIRFNVREAFWLPGIIKDKIISQQKNKLSKNGDLIVYSQSSRSQLFNERDALSKIIAIINKATHVDNPTPPEKKLRIEEIQTLAKERRMITKKMRKIRNENKHEYV